MKLHLKFAENTDDGRRDAITEDAQRLGAIAVRPLFPKGSDSAMRSMFIVDLGDDADPERVSIKLRGHAAVESVEPEFKRFLVA